MSLLFFFFFMIRRPRRSKFFFSSSASDLYQHLFIRMMLRIRIRDRCNAWWWVQWLVMGAMHDDGCNDYTSVRWRKSAASHTQFWAQETPEHLVCRLLLEKKKKIKQNKQKKIYENLCKIDYGTTKIKNKFRYVRILD